MEQDLTLTEVLVDPLIAQLRRADEIGFAAFAQLMESAARVHTRQLVAHVHEDRTGAFYRTVEIAASKNRVS